MRSCSRWFGCRRRRSLPVQGNGGRSWPSAGRSHRPSLGVRERQREAVLCGELCSAGGRDAVDRAVQRSLFLLLNRWATSEQVGLAGLLPVQRSISVHRLRSRSKPLQI